MTGALKAGFYQMIRVVAILLGLLAGSLVSRAQTIKGRLTDAANRPLAGMVFIDGTTLEVKTTDEGLYSIGGLAPGSYKVVAFVPGFQTVSREIDLAHTIRVVNFELGELETELEEVTVVDRRSEELGSDWLESVAGAAIYEAKKTEVITVTKVIGNKAANVGRQVYGRVPGLNIWENDGAGINLGIGGRGLNPNRTSNFNVRQNGYDIAADALGYPESYYTPSVLALERIELVRGAAGLQYGTQFGGMLNFHFKEGPTDRKVAVEVHQTLGSFGLYNGFVSAGGTVGKLNYYSFYQFKNSQGWRPNSEQQQHQYFTSVNYKVSAFLEVKLEHTYMTYLAHQPGGLTDLEFYQDPQQSKRARNWFDVGWNLTAMEWNYRLSSRLKFNNRTFHLAANRYAVGNLGRIDRPDVEEEERNLLKDRYDNWGNELRMVYHYPFLGKQSVLLVGNRLYRGKTLRQQGTGTNGSGADFAFNDSGEPEDSDFNLPSTNVAFFAEHIFNLTNQWSVTPGIRYEYIRTAADGYYYQRTEDLAGNVLTEEQLFEDRAKTRNFVFGGIGLSYKHQERLEAYANFSQNFRAINFNDIRVDNPSLRVDENIGDERGFNLDLGLRGAHKGRFRYDISLFYLSYKDRIGSVLRTEPDPRFNNLIDRTIRFRTNIADAAIVGLENYVEADLVKCINPESKHALTAFINLAIIHSRYVSNQEPGIEGKEVELVPPLNLKTGLTYRKKALGLSFLYTYVTEHFSDASNTDSTPPVPTAVEGIIPTYYVMDLSMDYRYQFITFEAGINNLTDQSYFTRRAAGYPGPGIIPANPRNYYFGIQLSF